MGEQKRKLSRQQRLLIENPRCCHCGGGTPSVTIDHVPPKATFLPDRFPETFEFPACASCNGSTRLDDQIFAFYATMMDWALPDAEKDHFEQLFAGIKNNSPAAIPSVVGQQLVDASPEFGKSVALIGTKMATAFYFKQTGGFLTRQHRIYTTWLNAGAPDDPTRRLYPGLVNTNDLLAYITQLLPEREIGRRQNIKIDRIRLEVQFGYKPEEDFFMFAAKFGVGLVVCGVATPDSSLPLNTKDPRGTIRGIFEAPPPEEQVA